MNGLEIIDQNEASFMDKVLRREPRENAFVEINNLLACVPIFKLDREAINKSLDKYEVEHEKARSRLLNFYTIILKHFLNDANLDNTELERLHHLKYIFTLDDREISSIHQNIVQPIYKRHVRKAISDGDLTEQESEGLKKIAERLFIPKEFAKKLYVNEASQYLHSVLKTSISDGMLSEGEEAELQKLAANLQVELRFSENAKKNLERCRYLWRLHQGDLPKATPPIRLNKKDECSTYVSAVFYKVYNKRSPVKYSGYHAVKGQKDYGFHSGMLKKNEFHNKELRFADQGTLYFLRHRLLFKGANGDKQFHFKNLIGGSFYKNGLIIEQKRGNDRFFKFSGDMEAIKLIFDTLMTQNRK